MKNVYVTLQGTGDVYWMESFVQDSAIIDNIDDYDLDDQIGLEEEGVLDGDLYELPFINGDLKVLLSTSSEPVWSEDDENAVDITNECECISRPNYLKEDCGLTVPLWVTITREETEVVETFCIELKDDEEFDPKKLQILRSTGEIDGVYNSIIVTDVLYDGNKIHYEDPEGYNNVEWFPTIVEEWLNDK